MNTHMRFVTDLSRGILGQPDSTELWQEIINHIPDSVLVKPQVKILNVACGHGTEADLLVQRMLKLGISKQQVQSSIYVLDKYHVFTNPMKRKGYTNVITADFLEWQTDMKFDVVVGNPPYQDKNQILWKKFADKAIQLVNEKGLIAFVTPNSWASGAKDTVFAEIFLKKDTKIINMNGSRYFPDIAKDIGYWILRNCPETGEYTTVYDEDNTPCQINLKSVPFFIRKFSPMAFGIFQKIHAKGQFWREFVERKPKYAREFAFPKTRYISNNKYGYRYDEVICDYPSSSVVVALDMTDYSLQEVKTLHTLFSSSIYKFLWYIYGASDAGSFGWILRNMPKVNLSRAWTNQELYEHFNLTSEEIEYIENSIK